MTEIFYLSEVLNFAIEREIASQTLYQTLAEKVSGEKAKTLFLKLAEQEKMHKAFYESMLNDVPHEQTPRVQEDNEYWAYTKQMIDDFRKAPDLPALDLDHLEAILDYAIDREQDAILFYSSLKNLVSKTAFSHIDEIIQEEASHAAKLNQFKKSL